MPAPDEEDWRNGVEPLAEPRRVTRTRVRPAPVPRETWRDERAALAESLGPISAEQSLESGEELAFVRNGYSPAMLRKLRRGHWVVEDSVDLHGLNRAQAATAVRVPAKRARPTSWLRAHRPRQGTRLTKPRAGPEKEGLPLAQAARRSARLRASSGRARGRGGASRPAEDLDRRLVGLACADAHHVLDRGDEDLAVADFPGARRSRRSRSRLGSRRPRPRSSPSAGSRRRTRRHGRARCGPWRPNPLTSVTVRPVTPTSESASRTSSSLNGFTIASIFFMAGVLREAVIVQRRIKWMALREPCARRFSSGTGSS